MDDFSAKPGVPNPTDLLEQKPVALQQKNAQFDDANALWKTEIMVVGTLRLLPLSPLFYKPYWMYEFDMSMQEVVNRTSFSSSMVWRNRFEPNSFDKELEK
jgi:hypothetical protein